MCDKTSYKSHDTIHVIVGRARSPHGKDGGGEDKKSLASVMRLELLQDKTAAEIAEIWTQHFAAKVRDEAYFHKYRIKHIHSARFQNSSLLRAHTSIYRYFNKS